MAYNKTYYTGREVESCTEPPESCLHEGLDWDAVNRGHCVRLTADEIKFGLRGGYVLYELDPHDCRYRILFQSIPLWSPGDRQLSPVWRLIIDTTAGKMRPISVMVEDRASAKKDFFDALRDGELE